MLDVYEDDNLSGFTAYTILEMFCIKGFAAKWLIYIYIPCASKHDKNVGFIPKHEVLGENTRFPIFVFFSAHAIFEGRATGT